MSNHALGDKLGLRQKWSGESWEPPYVNHLVPPPTKRILAAVYKHASGQTLMRDEMPEASAVYSTPHFERAKDVFFFGGFLAVKGTVAKVLSEFDFGEGGGLVPYTVFEPDEKTPLPGPFYIVNFGPFKDCFLTEASTNIRKLAVNQQTGQTSWTVSYVSDGDVAVSPAALLGSDLWTCPGIHCRIFMKDRVVQALKNALSDVDFADFELHRCRVVTE